jgi:Leucine-rich repeat (LRR) protein
MRRLLLITFALLILSACSDTKTATESPIQTATTNPTLTPTFTPLPTQTATAMPTITPTHTPVPTLTPTPDPITQLCATVTEIPQIECEALGILHMQQYGENWEFADAWMQTNRPCSWQGVQCSDQHVTELNIARSSWNSIPPEIGDLTHLLKLDLSYNNLNSVPQEIGNLTNLAWLSLCGNNLTEFPLEITTLPTLFMLDICDNQLRTLPTEIGAMPKLRWLSVWGNPLGSVPPEICDLKASREDFGLWLDEPKLCPP